MKIRTLTITGLLFLASFLINAQTLIMDQNQASTNYGYWFEQSVVRWQEFQPTMDNLSEIDLVIHKNGSPGAVIVQLRDLDSNILGEVVKPADEILPLGWVNFQFSQIISLTPGVVYRIYVYSSEDSPDANNRYFWSGLTTSTYPLLSDVSDLIETYDYAFKTYGFLTEVILKYDFNNSLIDESIYSNEGTGVGTITFQNNRFNDTSSSLYLDGSSYVTAADHQSLDLSEGISISAWIKPVTTSGEYIVFKRPDSGGGAMYTLDIYPGTIRVHLRDQDFNLITDIEGTHSIIQDEWQHIAFTYDGTTVKLFYNGVLENSSPASGTIGISSGNLDLGTYQFSNPPRYYEGNLDDVRIFNRGLSEAEIGDLYTEGGWPLNHPPVIENPMPHQIFIEGFGRVDLNIANVFSDPDGDALTFNIISSDPDVVTTSIEGTNLTIHEVFTGNSTITVVAIDNGIGNLSVQHSFNVLVEPLDYTSLPRYFILDSVETVDIGLSFDPHDVLYRDGLFKIFGDDGFNRVLSTLNLSSGEITDITYYVTGGMSTYGGAAWDGQNYWYTSSSFLVEVSEQGNVISNVENPNSWVGGLAWNNGTLYSANDDYLFEHHSNILETDTVVEMNSVGDICWVDNELWVVNRSVYPAVLRYDSTFKLLGIYDVNTFLPQNQQNTMAGITYDGSNLWLISSEYNRREMYRLHITETDYCTPSINASDKYIASVDFQEIANSSDKVGYEDYSDQFCKVATGGIYQLSVAIGNAGPTDEVKCWIDWNNDFDFEDENEEYILDTATPVASGNILVPLYASDIHMTEKRMRIAVNPAPGSIPCDGFSCDEAEDYSVFLTNDPVLQVMKDTVFLDYYSGSLDSLEIFSNRNWTVEWTSDWFEIPDYDYWGSEHGRVRIVSTSTNPYLSTRHGQLNIICQDYVDGSWVDVQDIVVTVIQERGTGVTHFQPVWTGNGLDHMNIYIHYATLDESDFQQGNEIGVFDGDLCVGAVFLYEVLDGSSVLDCKVSKDDPNTPEKDGYTPGNLVSFRGWDAASDIEYSYFTAEYLAGESQFSIGGSASVNIAFFSTTEQQIVLNRGWNIASFAVIPQFVSMDSVFDDLKQTDVLIKIQDESGNAMEKLPAPIGWINNIGNMSYTEGYKIKVASDAQKSVFGQPIELPFTIPLSDGWNIMGYPLLQARSASYIFDPLVASSQLVKVQDESGNAIEELPSPIGWIDNIGTLYPGEGYKVKVSDDVPAVFDTTLSKSLTVDGYARDNFTSSFYTTWEGYGLDHMNIYLMDPTWNGAPLLAGDEIAVFDGANCVGRVLIEEDGQSLVSLVVSADDPTTEAIDGFVEANELSLQIWRSSENMLGMNSSIRPFDGYIRAFEKNGTAVLNIDFESGSEDFLGEAYPNPARDQINIKIPKKYTDPISIKLMDMMGSVVRSWDIYENLGGELLLEVDDIPSGSYIIIVHLNQTPYMMKIIIEGN